MDNLGQGDSTGGKRHATLRWSAASLTATAGRTPFEDRGGPKGRTHDERGHAAGGARPGRSGRSGRVGPRRDAGLGPRRDARRCGRPRDVRRGGRWRARRDHRRALARRRRGTCDAARRQAAAGRAGLLLPARRAHRGQRPACVPALLHRLPVVPRPHRRDLAGAGAGSSRRARSRRGGHRGTTARQNRPHRAAGAAASRAQPGDVSASVAHRARQGRPCRSGAQGARPRRSGARRPELRQLARRARSVGARRRGTVGPGGGRHPQRGGRRLVARARRDGVQDRSAVRPGRGRHRLGARPAGRTARHTGPQGARHRGRPYRSPYTSHLHLPQRERALERSGSRRDTRRGHRGARRTSARGARSAARRRAGRPRATPGDRHRADPQRPRGLRPQGAHASVLRGARFPGAVGLRPHRGVRTAGGAVSGPVPVGRAARDRRARRRPARALSAGAGAAAARRPRRRGEGLLRDPGAHRDVRPRPWRRAAASRRPYQRSRPVSGRRVDRHRVARDHGERGPQRCRCGGSSTGRPGPAPRSPPRVRGHGPHPPGGHPRASGRTPAGSGASPRGGLR